MYSVKILADSMNPCGNRLTTMEVTYPLVVHAELMTHRVFSRNAGSNRAISNKSFRDLVEKDPFFPLEWLSEQKGMSGGEPLSMADSLAADLIWEEALESMLGYSKRLSDLGVHKSLANRLLGPFQWITVLITATDWDNFFNLRTHKDAEQHIRKIAVMMEEELGRSIPRRLGVDSWHIPLIRDEDWVYSLEDVLKIAVGRCARVSYLTHDGKRDPQADIDLCDRLAESGHLSPFEHVAYALGEPRQVGNLRGWFQYRKEFPGEDVWANPELPQ